MAEKAKPDWWEGFFKGSWIEFQRSMDEPALVEPAVDFLEAVLDLSPGERVLDAPCGDGRIGREFARRGYRVTGLDITPSLLKAGRREAKAEGLDVEWVEGDMRKLAWRNRHHLALCWWGSFGYFSDADNLRHVKAVARGLKPGGVFALDTHSPETLFPSFASRSWTERNGVLSLTENTYDTATGRIESEWTLIRGGKRRVARSSIRLYTVRELHELFRQAGFVEFREFADYEGESFGLDSRRLVFLATKSLD